jgi:hypothetical protein
MLSESRRPLWQKLQQLRNPQKKRVLLRARNELRPISVTSLLEGKVAIAVMVVVVVADVVVVVDADVDADADAAVVKMAGVVPLAVNSTDAADLVLKVIALRRERELAVSIGVIRPSKLLKKTPKFLCPLKLRLSPPPNLPKKLPLRRRRLTTPLPMKKCLSNALPSWSRIRKPRAG